MNEQTQRWPGFKYQPVPGLANRFIARYLRTQRKNMRRFFREQGLWDELELMERIRKSRQGMLAKNRMFQEVLNAYARRATPTTVPETADPKAAGDADVGVHDAGQPVSATDGVRSDAGDSVPDVAERSDAEPVIEE